MQRCKRPVVLEVADPTIGIVSVEASLHPAGCMGARYTHLDVPLEPLRGGLLEGLAGPRGGVALRARPAGRGCVELEPPGGLPSLRLCPRRPARLDLAGDGGVAYLRRVGGKLYLRLPAL
ncbi:MAG: hypothetical protein LRS49_06035 [Desulfurococcales archaeon]|nr:hypothetical protein [Desulfurococcales archaeon]